MSDKTENKTPMGEELSEAVTRACGALFPLVRSSGAVFPKIKVDLPETYGECNPYHVKELLNRVYTAVGITENLRTAEALRGAKGRVDAILDQIKAEELDAQEQIKALPAAVRARIEGEALKDWVGVPVSRLMSAFPDGTPESQAAVFLHDLNYKMVQGKNKEGLRVRLTIHETAPKPPTTRSGDAL